MLGGGRGVLTADGATIPSNSLCASAMRPLRLLSNNFDHLSVTLTALDVRLSVCLSSEIRSTVEPASRGLRYS